MDGFLGSSRCLPASSGASVASQVSEVLRGRFGLPVSLSLFRPCNSSAGLHPHHGTGLFHHVPVWLPYPSLPGQLACPRALVPGACSGEVFYFVVVSGAGHSHQRAKSSLTPAQSLDYLGMRLQTSPLRVFPTPKRVLKLSSIVHGFLSCGTNPLPVWHQLLGVVSSMSALVLGSRLRMRSLQLRLNVANPNLLDSAEISWDDSCFEDLRLWPVESHPLAGRPLDLSHPDLALFTDASDTSWGASLGDSRLSGLWSCHCSLFSINHRELLAVLYAIQGFLPLL